jgi:hypothetical protein
MAPDPDEELGPVPTLDRVICAAVIAWALLGWLFIAGAFQ